MRAAVDTRHQARVALAHCEYGAPVATFPIQVLNQPTLVTVVMKTEDEEFHLWPAS
jgi:hypothetical protein